MNPFEFSTADRILFGAGRGIEAPSLARAMGSRVCVLTGAHPERAKLLMDGLRTEGMAIVHCEVHGEPSVQSVLEAVHMARRGACDLVVGQGGGSVLDSAKAVAALLTNSGDLYDYLEVIGEGRKIEHAPAPCIAIPTTSGAGTEVTRNAVIRSPEHQVKVSMRSPMMIPRLALIDPDLMRSMPPDVTAATGLDALTQAIEPYVSSKANPLTDAVCREGMMCVARSLARAYRNGDDLEARSDMAIAALCGGMALANAKLGAAHGFAGPLGGMAQVPHGLICARLLPHVMAANLAALQTRAPDHAALTRFTEIAHLLTGRAEAAADEGVAWLQQLCSELKTPPLTQYGLTMDQIPEAVAKACKSSSMKGNPIELTDKELTGILKKALN